MDTIMSDFNNLNEHKHYAEYIKTNLHVHTPFTQWDWDAIDGQTLFSKDLTIEKFFNHLQSTKLDLIAITDHNCVCWCEQMIKLAKKHRKERGSNLVVLPGVEITTYEGPHIIAIFDENKPITEINTMLVNLGLSGNGNKDEKVGDVNGRKLTIFDVFTTVELAGGIIIGPHIDSKDGVWGNSSFRGRNDVLNDPRLRILAAGTGEIKRVEKNGVVRLLYKNMNAENITNSFAFINPSDCHRIDDLEKNCSWIKMSQRGLLGVKQIIYEPELRVAHSLILTTKKVEFPVSMIINQEPTNCTHDYIIGIAINGGMLDQENIKFSPNLNCIIGRNYSGKSALIDCLRFGLNVFPEMSEVNSIEDPYFRFSNRIRGILEDGSQVKIFISSKGCIYCISRLLTTTKVGGSNEKTRWKIEGYPEIYKQYGMEFRKETDLLLSDLFLPEVYPQGEVVKIKDNANQQIKIVDSISNVQADLSDLMVENFNGQITLLGELSNNLDQIVREQNELDNHIAQTSGIDQLKSEIAILEKIVASPLYKNIKTWTEIKDEISRKSKGFNEQLLSMEDLPELTTEEIKSTSIVNVKIESGTPLKVKEYINKFCNSIALSVEQNKESNKLILQDAINKLVVIEQQIENRENKELEKINKISVKTNESPNSEILERITEKRTTLANKIEHLTESGNNQSKINNLLSKRQSLLQKAYEIKQKIRDNRKSVIEKISSECAENVKVELIENGNYQNFRNLLDLIADNIISQTVKILSKQEQLDLISENISPSEFLRLIKNNEIELLRQAVTGLSQNTARLFCTISQQDQLKIEQCFIDDSLEVRYKREGEDSYTSIMSGLSGGEQAIALISIAMVQKGMPLIIDQPEDELGPALITNELVNQIRKTKSKRQLIFVTHVPNIPVLADSDHILHIQQEYDGENNKKSKIKPEGSLDNNQIIEKLIELDGGILAFQKREARYAPLVKK